MRVRPAERGSSMRKTAGVTRNMRSRAWVRLHGSNRSRARAVVAITAALLVSGTLAGCRRVSPSPSKRTLKYLTYLTPSTGSFSSDLVTRVKAALPNVDVINEETSGSLVVLSALQERKGDFGFSLADAAYVAYRHGIEPN